jgi:hypothetical protein
MELSLRSLVRSRAKAACEYCRFPEAEGNLPYTLDHIVARQHLGTDAADNLAFACPFCNLHKGTNLTGIDPDTGTVVRLFNPRADPWSTHFRWDNFTIVPLTPTGRATVVVLALNHERQLARRRELLKSGWLLREDL